MKNIKKITVQVIVISEGVSSIRYVMSRGERDRTLVTTRNRED